MQSNKKPLCVIIGGGGHASVLLDAIRLNNSSKIYGILDKDQSRHGTDFYGVPVIGGDELLPGLKDKGVDFVVIGIGSVKSVGLRKKIFEDAIAMGYAPLEVIHPTAICSNMAKIGKGCQILPGVIINAGAELGVNVTVNSSAVVEHDCKIGDHVHIATGAKLASTVIVGGNSFIGAGSVIRQCINIGKNVTIGAGAVVIHDVQDNQTVVGNPAKPLNRKKEII